MSKSINSLEELLHLCTVKLTIDDSQGWGTGFFVAPGRILTCAHVIQGADQRVSIRWQQKDNLPESTIERVIPEVDLALLRFDPPQSLLLPCVYLDASVSPRDALYSFGYPDKDFPNGCPVTFDCEGLTGDKLVKFKLGRLRPGMSGSPLLNHRTGKVCGMVKFTLDRTIDLGGGAIPAATILDRLPELKEWQSQFHNEDLRWSSLLVNLSKISHLSKISSKFLESSIIEFVIQRCEVGLRRLISCLDEVDPRCQELRSYQTRLNEITEQTEQGDGAEVSIEQLEAIIEYLDPHSRSILDKPFEDLYNEIGDAKVDFLDYPRYPDENFTGREEVLKKYTKQLTGTTRCVIISGIAGIGKTELAANIRSTLIGSHGISEDEILWAWLDEDDTVQGWWTACAEVASSKGDKDAAKLLGNLSVKYNEKRDCLVKFFTRQISIIFLDDYHKIIGNEKLESLISELISNCPKTKFVITSRRYVDLPGKLQEELKGLDSESGVRLLKRLNDFSQNADEMMVETDDSLLEPIVEHYHGHTLALQIIAGIRRRMNISARELRDSLRNDSIWHYEDRSLTGLLGSLFEKMTHDELALTATISLLRHRVTSPFLERLYPENSGNLVKQIRDLFLLDTDKFVYHHD
jgi:Trypsin-like peptidase domain/NB-ARC domain